MPQWIADVVPRYATVFRRGRPRRPVFNVLCGNDCGGKGCAGVGIGVGGGNRKHNYSTRLMLGDIPVPETCGGGIYIHNAQLRELHLRTNTPEYS